VSHDSLGEFEKLVMLAILRLAKEAYGAAIIEELDARAGRRATPGAVYVALRRLEKKGMVTSRLGEPTPTRGGRPKRYFRVEEDGIEALRRAQAEWKSLAEGLGPVLEGEA